MGLFLSKQIINYLKKNEINKDLILENSNFELLNFINLKKKFKNSQLRNLFNQYYNQAFSKENDSKNYLTQFLDQTLEKDLEDDYCYFWTTNYNQKFDIVGFIGWTEYKFLSSNHPYPSYIFSFFISPKYQNLGFGQLLLKKTVDYLESKFGSKKLILETQIYSNNKISQHLFIKNGFTKINSFYEGQVLIESYIKLHNNTDPHFSTQLINTDSNTDSNTKSDSNFDQDLEFEIIDKNNI